MEGMDLFEHYEKLPSNVKEVLNKYSDENAEYSELEKMASELKELGYTFEYGLDAVPYNLKKIKKETKMDNSKEIKEIKEELASKYTPDFIKVKLKARLAELESAPVPKSEVKEPKAKAEKKEGASKMTEFANYVKSIRKDGESWKQAMARASRIKKGTEPKEKPKAKKIVRKAKPTPKPKAKKFVRKAKPVAKVVAKKIKKPKRKSDGLIGTSNTAVDKKVKALHGGKRFARKGWKNQFGKSDGKGVYYEKRRDHADANRTKKL